MKKEMLFIMALIASLAAGAQTAERQVLGSAGGGFNGSGLQADYTLGETVTQSASTGSFSVSQGFQQNTAGTTTIKEQILQVRFTLYPNPAQDKVTLSLSADQAFDMKLSLSNLAGTILYEDQSAEKVSTAFTRTVPLQGYADGIYFVNLYDAKNALLQSIRIVKQ